MINILDETYDNRFIDAVKAQIIRPDIIDGYGESCGYLVGTHVRDKDRNN
ncbi:hypothetical protein KGF42_13895 [Clostridioides sp. ZZV15-6383]|nr:hypothetical protein [Clostridioides sp. ZZV14-6345]MCC0700479.1 hypothetical protein [Clostridioides sp. ZZV15-6383]